VGRSVRLMWYAIQLGAVILLWPIGITLLVVALSPDDIFDRWS
jgi:hypothetical protein